MSGDVPKTVQVKRVFEYTNHREHPASLATKSSSLQLHVASSENVRFKTRLCKHGASECQYGVRCLFAHGVNELRPKPDSVPAAKNTTAPQERQVTSSVASSGSVPTEQHSLVANFTRSVQLPLVSDNVSSSLPLQILPVNNSMVGSGTPLPVNTDTPLGGPTQAVLPVPLEVNAVSKTCIAPSAQSTEIILDESPPISSTPFRGSVLMPGETRTPVVKGGLKRPHAASASTSPAANHLTAAQLSSPVSLTTSPVHSPQSSSAKQSNSAAAVTKADMVAAAAEIAKQLSLKMTLAKSPTGTVSKLRK